MVHEAHNGILRVPLVVVVGVVAGVVVLFEVVGVQQVLVAAVR